MTDPRHILLNPKDNVVVAIDRINPGDDVAGITAAQRVGKGHKMARNGIAEGEAIYKFGQIIGFATSAISPGDHIHTHNCAMGDFDRDYRFAEDAGNDHRVDGADIRAFDGFSPGQWPDRYAQLYRCAHIGELLGVCCPVYRRGSQQIRHSG